MGLVFCGIAPHGFSIIEEIAGKDTDLFLPIREGLTIFGERLKRHDVDTIIVITPHGLRLKGHHAIYTTESCNGTLSQYGKTVSINRLCDQDLAQQLLTKFTENDLHFVGCHYGAMSGELSNIPMDWGTLIPLWFSTTDEKKPKIVVIGPTRERPLEELILVGKMMAEVIEASGKKVALIASADQAHTHDEHGPYGYTPHAKVFDDMIQKLVKNNTLEELLHVDEEIINKAKPDSVWQLLMLHGALQVKPLKVNFIKYQCPTYFGMLVASYEN